MKEDTPPEQIEAFLDGLWKQDRTLAVRAYSAYFIQAHGAEIERHIQRKIAESGGEYARARWALRTRALVRQYEQGPRGYAYNPGKGTLESTGAGLPRSFRVSGEHRASLTFDTEHRTVRVVGYVLAALIAGFVLWAGYTVYRSLQEYTVGWGMMLEEALGK